MDNLEQRLESLRAGVGDMRHGLPGNDGHCTRLRLTDEEREAMLLAAARNDCFRQGCDASDNNRRVYRNRRGAVVSCPYDVGTDQAKWWNEGYQYRDMVNDG
jgi:hypothetical protein